MVTSKKIYMIQRYGCGIPIQVRHDLSDAVRDANTRGIHYLHRYLSLPKKT
jgi:hypothetical protein